MDELAARAEALDFVVCSSRSIEASCGPVFWPWIQILQALLREQPGSSEALQAIIARLMTYPELTTAEAGAPSAQWLPMASDRFWQYEAVASALQAAARQRPLLLLFDDLHWADRGTWELLGFLAPELRRWPILIIGARREERAGGREARAPTPRDAARFKLEAERARRGALPRAAHGQRPGPVFVRGVARGERGQPLVLARDRRRAARAARRRGARHAGYRCRAARGAAVDRLRGRIAALAPETSAVLQMASVLGERFDLELLSRMSERPSIACSPRSRRRAQRG